jgi:hypothetical protein
VPDRQEGEVAYDEDYRALMEGARDALRDLLEETHLDLGVRLRAAYGQLRRELEGDDEGRRSVAERDGVSERKERELRESREREQVWKQTPIERRESLLLQVLADEGLTINELVGRVNAELCPPDTNYLMVYEPALRVLVKRMFAAGQLERVGEPACNGQTRYRYFRKRGLDGPIADLDRAYHHDGEPEEGA